jgi:DNA-binding phage protein
MARRKRKLEDSEVMIMAVFFAAFYIIKAALMVLPMIIEFFVALLIDVFGLLSRASITAASSVHWRRIGDSLRMPSIISMLPDNFFYFLSTLYLIGGLLYYLKATPNIVSAIYLSISLYIIKLYGGRRTRDLVRNNGDPENEKAIYEVSAPDLESTNRWPKMWEKQSTIERDGSEHSDYDPRNDLVGDWPKIWKGQPTLRYADADADADADAWARAGGVNPAHVFSSTLRDGISSRNNIGADVKKNNASVLFHIQTQSYALVLINRYVDRLNEIINGITPIVNEINGYPGSFEGPFWFNCYRQHAKSLVSAYYRILTISNEVGSIKYSEDLSGYFNRLKKLIDFRLSAIDNYSKAIHEALVSGIYSAGSGISRTNKNLHIHLDLVPIRDSDLINGSSINNRLGRALTISSSSIESDNIKRTDSKDIPYKSKKSGGHEIANVSYEKNYSNPTIQAKTNEKESTGLNIKSSSSFNENNLGVQLDLSAVRSLEEESQKVSEILSQIFSGEKETASKYQTDASPLPSCSQTSANEIGKEPISLGVSDIAMEGIRLALSDSKITAVAKATGLSRQAIYKIMDGTTPAPRMDTYQKLVTYLQGSSSQDANSKFLPDGAPVLNSLPGEINDIGRESIISVGSDITMEGIRLALRDRKISVVAEATGLSRQFLYNIIDGTTSTLRIDTYQKLVEYLCGNTNPDAQITIHSDGMYFSSEEQPPQEQALVWGLNKEISSFARLIITKDLWRRDELETLAKEQTLMLDGVLEEINEAAFDIFDQALIEGDDPYEVNKNLAEKIS